MKAAELRIGNLVTIENKSGWPEMKNKPVSVSGITWKEDKQFPKSSHTIEVYNKNNYRLYNQFNEFINPIPLTEEWLSDFGFYKNIGHYKIFGRFKDRTLEIADNNDTSEKQYYVYIRGFHDKEFVSVRHDLKFVHELQNLYFTLTSEELTVKA